ncbi:alanine/glycine:cation symporter family protein [Natranaerobius thermophilus]|uniref:Amino acid carrier protein n=1 Tax=Natranaerobius thermophilus (strain ATCC BAA-1301 / DSM 18059 / JW/NM-WN-LF) TaxID=457570 RepID=B2A1J9_NATTJ|nr:sodium:alanine symporter family protein [Natranaerobius thermophilus]ACB84739.1 amino acid carrier protein [Natranaerobius thermophilus JW/NM-WN-LF]
MDSLSVIESINNVLWGPVMLVLLLGTGVLFTIKLRFIQLRRLKDTVRETFKKNEGVKADDEGMSSFQALATAIAAQVGTGNLAGVATAIAAGGPGAVFWMWISGFFGMGTIFAEAVISQVYTEKVGGRVVGGPAYYIKHGLGSKALAGFFAVAIVLALGFMGNMVQSNSIADAVNSAFQIPPLVTGLVIAFLVGLIVIGGMSRIAHFTSNVVPIMAVFYLFGAFVIILTNYQEIIPAIKMIVYGAFNPAAATGGIIGVTIREVFRYGIARGLFSNEAGMGSTPHAHAVAKVKHPAQQGLVGIFGVLFDTLIVCTVTALVIIITEAYTTDLVGIELTQYGFYEGFGELGNSFIAISMFFFALSTIISWYFFAEANIRYLFGTKFLRVFQGLVLIFVVIGTSLEVTVVWELADTFNGLMVIPNLIALLGMVSLVVKILNDYENNYEEDKSSTFEKEIK